MAATKSQKMSNSGHTVEQHEMTHYHNSVSIYSDIEREWKALAGKCMTTRCYDATLKYLGAYTEAMHAYARYVNSSFDYMEYAPGQDKDEKGKEAGSALNDYHNKMHGVEQLSAAQTTQCAGD